jgi:hypothetical protein
MSGKSFVVGGFLALAALLTSTSSAQAQFISNRTVVSTASGYRSPIYHHHSYNGGFGTPLVTSSYYPQVVPFYQRPVVYAPVFTPTYGVGFGNGFGGGFNPYYGGGYVRPGVNLGFNFNFR